MAEQQTPSRRTTDHIPADLDNFVQKTEVREKRFFIGSLVSLSIIALCTAVALVAFGFVVRYNHDLVIHANEEASKSSIATELAREKICSQSSDQEVACQALFERLANSITDSQRFRLACKVIFSLEGATARSLRAENPGCKVFIKESRSP